MSTVLIVEDEARIASFLTKGLRAAGFTPRVVARGGEAVETALQGGVDLILLDVGLPDIDGFEVLERLRGQGVRTPIIMLTARSSVEDRVAGLSGGADDYVAKPFSPRELALRARAVTRRAGAGPEAIENGPLRVSTLTGRVSWAGRSIPLPDTEAKLLAALARRHDTVITWQDLLGEVWGASDDAGGKEMVRTTVYRLRRHLQARGISPEIVVSARGRGYLMPRLDGA